MADAKRQVMPERGLAALYGAETRVLNHAANCNTQTNDAPIK